MYMDMAYHISLYHNYNEYSDLCYVILLHRVLW